jgi:pimeloyl-ACP methyl ester carboxylesterase
MHINNLKIGITEFGDPNGEPVLYFHGFPGSGNDGNLFDFNNIGIASNTRIIGIDRPGIGFSILGISGGGPYALACAYAIPERLHSVSIISGMGPFDYQESMIGKAMLVPKQNRFVRRLIALGLKAGAMKSPDKLKEKIKKTLPAADIKYLSQPNKMSLLIDIFNDCFSQGLKGYLYEAKLYRRKWGFNISEINTNVYLWHGTSDNNVNIELAKRIASEIPNCKSTFIENEGHFSIAGKYLEKILIEMKY